MIHGKNMNFRPLFLQPHYQRGPMAIPGSPKASGGRLIARIDVKLTV